RALPGSRQSPSRADARANPGQRVIAGDQLDLAAIEGRHAFVDAGVPRPRTPAFAVYPPDFHHQDQHPMRAGRDAGDGGFVTDFQGNPRGRVQSFVDTAELFLLAESCRTDPRVTYHANDLTDPTIVREAHRSCAGSTDVDLYTVVRGGHTWPSGPHYL